MFKMSIKMLVLIFTFSVFLTSCSSGDSETAKLRQELDELKKKNQDSDADNDGEDTEELTELKIPEGQKKTKAQVSMDSGSLTIRDAPDADTGKKVGNIPNGGIVSVGGCQKNQVKIGSRTGAWCQATYKGKSGWIFSGYLVAPGKGKKTNYRITATSAGDIKLGQTISEAKKAMTGAKFSPRKSCDGLDEMVVTKGGKTIMKLGAIGGATDDSSKISYINVVDRNYKTPAGVRTGMTVGQVENKYGTPFFSIGAYDNCSVETADFGNNKFSFRTDGAGEYDGRRETDKYDSNAKITEIRIDNF